MDLAGSGTVQWWVLVSMVIKLQVPEKMQSELTWANITFSMKYLIRSSPMYNADN